MLPTAASPVPAYGTATLADLTPSVLASLGVRGESNVLSLPEVRRVCLLLVDGLGWELVAEHPEAAPYLTELSRTGRMLDAGFPATTATSLASVGTGLPPGRHGMLGLQLAIPGEGRLMNCLRWDGSVPPREWQPHPTLFERAEADAVAASHVGTGKFRDSGLTQAALRGSRYVAAETHGEVVAGARAALRSGDRTLVYVYHPDLDSTGHRNGCGSASWRYQLAYVDRLVEQLADVLPADAALYVTADHGMVDVAPEDRVDADRVPALRDGVVLLGGEPRARYLYTRAGASGDVRSAWQELLGDRMWVVSRSEAVAAGWFGPEVPQPMLDRVGDVVAAARDSVAVVASVQAPHEAGLVGHHGSLTATEQRVPLLRVGPG